MSFCGLLTAMFALLLIGLMPQEKLKTTGVEK